MVSVVYGGKNPTPVQEGARMALRQAAAAYQRVKAEEGKGKPITDQQALDAALRGFHPELFQKQERANQRRDEAAQKRHRAIDIGAGVAQGGFTEITPSKLEAAAAYRSASRNGFAGSRR